MKTVVRLTVLLSILLLVTGAASAFDSCAIDRCYSVEVSCKGHTGNNTYWHACANSTANGNQGTLTSCSGWFFGFLSLDMYEEGWMAYGDVYSIPEAWFIEFWDNGRKLTGIGGWQGAPDVQCTVSGQLANSSMCTGCNP